jgi:hypothetical protein
VRIVTVAHMAFVSEASGARQRPRDEGRCQLPQCHVDLLHAPNPMWLPWGTCPANTTPGVCVGLYVRCGDGHLTSGVFWALYRGMRCMRRCRDFVEDIRTPTHTHKTTIPPMHLRQCMAQLNPMCSVQSPRVDLDRTLGFSPES